MSESIYFFDRSCVNYEGPDRIEHILSSARRVRASCGQEVDIHIVSKNEGFN